MEHNYPVHHPVYTSERPLPKRIKWQQQNQDLCNILNDIQLCPHQYLTTRLQYANPAKQASLKIP